MNAPNLVPTPATRTLARRMIAAAQQTTGADAALLFDDCWTGQEHALIGLLLTAVKLGNEVGRPRMVDRFTTEQRREGWRLWQQGDRREWVLAAKREYQRHHRRRYRKQASAA